MHWIKKRGTRSSLSCVASFMRIPPSCSSLCSSRERHSPLPHVQLLLPRLGPTTDRATERSHSELHHLRWATGELHFVQHHHKWHRIFLCELVTLLYLPSDCCRNDRSWYRSPKSSDGCSAPGVWWVCCTCTTKTIVRKPRTVIRSGGWSLVE